MNIKKYMILGGVGLAMGLSSVSCVGDLDLEPIDPTKIFADPADPEFVGNAFAECYAIMGFAGTAGPGDANLSVPDAGASVYSRVIFEMQEFPTDEAFWIWEDNGLRDMNTNNYSASNKQIEICYSRLYQHIAICNSFLSVTEDNAANPEIAVMRDEVRTTGLWISSVTVVSPSALPTGPSRFRPRVPKSRHGLKPSLSTWSRTAT